MHAKTHSGATLITPHTSILLPLRVILAVRLRIRLVGASSRTRPSMFMCARVSKSTFAFSEPIKMRRLTIIYSDSATRTSFAVLVNTAISRSPAEIDDELKEREDDTDWLNVDARDFDAVLEQKMGLPKSANGVVTGAETKNEMDVDQDGEAEEEEDGGMTSKEIKDAEDMLAREQAARLQDLAKKVEKFLGGKGDVEGAKFEE